jgi:hypothetical protein
VERVGGWEGARGRAKGGERKGEERKGEERKGEGARGRAKGEERKGEDRKARGARGARTAVDAIRRKTENMPKNGPLHRIRRYNKRRSNGETTLGFPVILRVTTRKAHRAHGYQHLLRVARQSILLTMDELLSRRLLQLSQLSRIRQSSLQHMRSLSMKRVRQRHA